MLVKLEDEMERELKNELIELLKDNDVVSEIQKIVANMNKEYTQNCIVQNDAETQKTKINELNSLVDELKKNEDKLIECIKDKDREIDEKNKEIEKLNNTITDLNGSNSELEKEKTKYKTQVDKNNEEIRILNTVYKHYMQNYYELDNIYSKYKNLGDEILSDLERILNKDVNPTADSELFMAYGVQEGNIDALWGVIATNVDKYMQLQKLDDLVSIFNYFINLYKKITYKNVCINYPQEGEVYDERIHTRTTRSLAVGNIKKVILPGLSIGKNINKKALVIVS